MADLKQNYFQKRTKDRGPRSNNRIISPEVQVIATDGENLGVLNTNEAISMAKNQGLDLIEIAPNANPPVCKIMDMGKYKYDAQKKANLAKKKQKIVSLKEIKMRPVTETHDYEFKVKNAKKFIAKGDKVKFTIRFKGRELQHSHLGNELMSKIKEDMKDIGKVELKEIKLRPVTEVHDYTFKIKNAQKFLSKGDKVKFTIKFKGRELQHSHLGNELMGKIKEDMKDIGKVELHPKFDGKQMIMVIQPL